MNFLSKTTILGLIIIAGVFISCSDSNNEVIAPQLPPSSSMNIDFSEIEQSGNSKTAAGANFNAALFRVGIAKLILDANVAIPKFLITAAQNKSPEEVSSGEYQWRYSANNQETSFAILLTAKVDATDNVDWKFYVTTDATNPPLNNSLLFSGEADYDGTDGTWTYFDGSDQNPLSVLKWDVDSPNDVALNFTVLSNRNGNEDSEINYTYNGKIKTVMYIDGSNGNKTTIEYNVETKAGFIISPDYNEGEKACWDTNLNNVPCA